MSTPELQVRKLSIDAQLPAYQTDGASGMDLHAAQDIVVGAWERAIVDTGVAVEIPEGCEGQVRPRSGLAARHGITVLNSPGTIDNDYRGELKVILVNHSNTDFEVRVGDRIAQLVLVPVVRVRPQWVPSLSTTARQEGKFGSTGV